MHQKQERTQAEYRAYDSGVRAIVGDLNQLALLPFPSSSGSGGPPATPNGSVAVAMESRKTKRERVQQAIALAGTCQKMVAGLGTTPHRASADLQTIMSLQETTELLQNEMGFSVKFDKDYKNTEITDASATAMCNKAEDITSKIVQVTKCIRALVGPGGSRDLLWL